jgi:hypothetical protein
VFFTKSFANTPVDSKPILCLCFSAEIQAVPEAGLRGAFEPGGSRHGCQRAPDGDGGAGGARVPPHDDGGPPGRHDGGAGVGNGCGGVNGRYVGPGRAEAAAADAPYADGKARSSGTES